MVDNDVKIILNQHLNNVGINVKVTLNQRLNNVDK